MKRPLALYAAPVMLFGKSVALGSVLIGSAADHQLRLFGQPLLFLTGALWLYFQPKWARWIAGAFFLYAALRTCFVLPTFQGSTLDLVRRPFSLAVAAWFAYALLWSREVREYVATRNGPIAGTKPQK